MVKLQVTTDTVLDAVLNGLSQNPKRLPSWLFYDEQGDLIFQEIMQLPEYYPTRCEWEILNTHRQEIVRLMKGAPFQLVELGAGDGIKTEVLLAELAIENVSFTYVPVDVSPHVLSDLKSRIELRLPAVNVEPLNARIEYIQDELGENIRKVFLYLGANIGNLGFPEAKQFVKKLTDQMQNDDLLMIGFDLKKDPRVILRAYDDPAGVTREFNLNLLSRLNRELGTDFRREQFDHYPYYDPETGITKSFLVSNTDQQVYLPSEQKRFHFRKWETIHTEISLKYDLTMIDALARHAGLRTSQIFYDRKRYFCDVIFSKRLV